MHLPQLYRLAVLVAAASAQAKVYQGFNSGATLSDNTAKKQSDYEAEFKTAQTLQGSPGLFNSVRLYTNVQSGTTDTQITAFAAAVATNTSMLLGIWCSGTTNITSELTALKAALTQYGQTFADLVVGISVGSEDLYRVSESGIANKAGLGAGPTDIVKFITLVRSTIKGTALSGKPVGHVDTWSAWANSSNSAVVDAVDFVGTDLYPYYETDKQNVFTNAVSIFDSAFNKTMTAAGNKTVWITETGWPTSGPNSGQAIASVDNAKAYWDEIGCRYFGKTNVWWYNLRDSNPANSAKFAISPDLSTTPSYNITCAAGSGAPAAINVKSAAVDFTSGLSWNTYISAFVLVGSLGYIF